MVASNVDLSNSREEMVTPIWAKFPSNVEMVVFRVAILSWSAMACCSRSSIVSSNWASFPAHPERLTEVTIIVNSITVVRFILNQVCNWLMVISPERVVWRTHRDLNTGYKLRKLM